MSSDTASRIESEVRRRRTFAIISHPDAGKTTLTEKLLLFSGAIQIAGSVKARKASRHATSDWMEIEKQRGISVASSVMQMEYRDCVINLLDTPGHQDFSEDTYRVLTAVDAALMVIDAANGVEPQTRRLLQVCRARNTPILTFVNKMDREVRQPLDLMDEIERELGMSVVPFTWPVGMGKFFGGVLDLGKDQMRVFSPGEERATHDDEIIEGLANPVLEERFGSPYMEAASEVELVREAAPGFDEAEFLAGRQTPMFFGSAINNFGVREVLDALVDMAPAPGPRPALQREVQPGEPKFTGVVFKIQANMDPAHRDRIAFLRVASGHFERGMRLKVVRSGKELRPNTVVSFLSQRRELLEEAFGGDIIGIPNHGVLQLGDTLTEGESLQFTGLPFFAPEMFRAVEVADPLRTKQLRAGLTQLGEEGAIQVFRPVAGSVLLLGAVGQLQFEVVAHRLEHEYGVKARIMPARYNVARWVTCDEADGGERELKRFIDGNSHRVALDAVDAPCVLLEYAGELRAMQENWPKIKFHALREHAGLVFQKQLEG
ncbi:MULTISPECIES: peptide chain release factor 3 [Rubrivivax]|uniref:Peptide chain release factor 3 n=1 Tax=Rubrivivax benzoatilyticus TaxID=316997 RepID=A0ABX0HUU7_9BURK|nr:MULTISPECIES: peptide chain release factor 3 [Rubrivivax]MCD0421135.1 peptide chain release factor 3 [Rubrivivax sp. JA1024]EGJ09699.1 peptide chain release factor 3 [Rubrivivax benzoatilyticus JA2 = ATCC BAA-35]MCC9596816.1 peptide chain release factor 3 [Rubrivivax sp. JA1055]MCC9648973.1 peptide chain release factor 3 [Rubrivivax sp. JA1029]NHK98804.1 peptide chain release factor 3 [Rubrivivax benzoatilyticus]